MVRGSANGSRHRASSTNHHKPDPNRNSKQPDPKMGHGPSFSLSGRKTFEILVAAGVAVSIFLYSGVFSRFGSTPGESDLGPTKPEHHFSHTDPRVPELLDSLIDGVKDALKVLDKPNLDAGERFEAWNQVGSSFVGIGPYIQTEHQSGKLEPFVKEVREHLYSVQLSDWPCYALGDVLLVAKYVGLEEGKSNALQEHMRQACIEDLPHMPLETRTLLMRVVPTAVMCRLGMDGTQSFVNETLRRFMSHRQPDNSFVDDYPDLVKAERGQEDPSYPNVGSDYVTTHAFMALVACGAEKDVVESTARHMVKNLPTHMRRGQTDIVMETVLFLKWANLWKEDCCRDSVSTAYGWVASQLRPGGLCPVHEVAECKPHWHTNAVFLGFWAPGSEGWLTRVGSVQ
eukprot:comp6348_c0_seq1/m.2140 comp6348_c0_seq1/g.2140  ORF comp6348_c0_seq1/g.2140 comp6348_c0_seq1/m.2140 type:complete len:400 (-) comp6348_c0_seq1:406-1605(-)